MEMANILRRRAGRVIKTGEFIFFRIVIPALLIISMAIVALTFFPEKQIITAAESLPVFNDNLENLIAAFPFIYPLFVFSFSYVLYYLFLHFVLRQKAILPENHYYLVPTWTIKLASFVNALHAGSATSIPVWQFCEYLFNHTSLGWRGISLEIPDVNAVDTDTQVKVLKIEPKQIVTSDSILSVVVADTYPIDLKRLPKIVLANKCVVLQTLQNGVQDRVRRYNPKLVSELLGTVRRAETEGVKSLYLLLNTNPKQISEMFREVFNDAGRNSIEHLYVFESQPNPPYLFTKAHQIF